MEQRKLRIIKPAQVNATVAYGITIPPNISIFYKETYFSVSKIDEGILLTSGTKTYSKEEIEKIDLEDFKI